MIENTIPKETARRYYDWLGARHDLGGRHEREAKELAFYLLDPKPGEQVLNVGVGTGKEQTWLETAVAPAHSFGIDISPVMLGLTQERAPQAHLCEADAGRLPFADGRFHRLLSTYVLDLIPAERLPLLLSEFRRVLKPNGRLVLVSLTTGVNLSSRVIINLWQTVYRLHPLTVGGCRPVQLYDLVREAGFKQVMRDVVVQLGMPSEVIVAAKGSGD